MTSSRVRMPTRWKPIAQNIYIRHIYFGERHSVHLPPRAHMNYTYQRYPYVTKLHEKWQWRLPVGTLAYTCGVVLVMFAMRKEICQKRSFWVRTESFITITVLIFPHFHVVNDELTYRWMYSETFGAPTSIAFEVFGGLVRLNGYRERFLRFLKLMRWRTYLQTNIGTIQFRKILFFKNMCSSPDCSFWGWRLLSSKNVCRNLDHISAERNQAVA